MLNVILTEKLPCAGTYNNLKYCSRSYYCCGLPFSEHLFGLCGAVIVKLGIFNFIVSYVKQMWLCKVLPDWLSGWFTMMLIKDFDFDGVLVWGWFL